MSNPLISVIMPIYNSENFLDEAISSILNQTFTDFELIAINDASTDNSLSIIKKYANDDERVIIINNDINNGFITNLNRGIKIAKGKYIARMDSDDIANSERFVKQIEILENNPKIGIVGSWVKELNSKNIFKYPINHESIHKYLLVGSPIGHPAAMIRKSVLLNNNFYYNPEYVVAQDYELWSRLLEVTEGYNIPLELLYWRKHNNQRSETKKAEKFNNTFKISKEIFEKRFPDFPKDRNRLENILLRKKETNFSEILKSLEFFKEISNDISPESDIYLYNKFAKKIYLYLRNNIHHGFKVFLELKRSKWNMITKKNLKSTFKFIILSIFYSLKRVLKK